MTLSIILQLNLSQAATQKKTKQIGFSRLIIAIKVMQNAPVEHSAVLLTCIEISHGFETFVLTILSGHLRQVSL